MSERFVVCLTKDEAEEAAIGMAFLALHHRKQIKDWKLVPTDGTRGKYFLAWKQNHQRVIAHHERCIAECSALAGKLGARDWSAAEAKAKARLEPASLPKAEGDGP